MASHTIEKVHVLFAYGTGKSELEIREQPSGKFEVTGLHYSVSKQLFPSYEHVERRGIVHYRDVERLVSEMLSTIREGWYHHYLREFTTQVSIAYWHVRITYADGAAYQWSGIDDAPSTIAPVLDAVVRFGMPPVVNGAARGFTNISCDRDPGAEFRRLTCYQTLFDEARSLESQDESDARTKHLATEFIEDIRRFVREREPKLLTKAALRIWNIEPRIEQLGELDTNGAPRLKMLALFAALTQTAEPETAAINLYKSGVLSRWCARLEEIPHEEREEQQRIREERRQALLVAMDDDVRDRMARGETFTSYEVARRTGGSAQQASSRIRRFVRKGELRPVGDSYPRSYQAAS